ncbi:MAG: multifunctional CCA addition/repair protein [Magnetococcales bacterium]|nr:multifunctional CCA addition/repair protein [Magnetococcales bacterium]
MNAYRVGGCVRDALLGIPAKERDWLVVGETPEGMLARGFRQVGAEFPVYLHPETREEYALARTERKSGPGYKGFEVACSPEIALEEDLARRDLTINAMALDHADRLIDPFGGERDVRRRVLRHVSPAFAEDPLRVLRVARFLARFNYLGFTIDPETLGLMGELARAGELAHLTSERVWQETVLALRTRAPEVFFQVLERCGGLVEVFPELAAMRGKCHSPVHHPEGDAWAHAMLVLRNAAGLTPDPVVRFAALTHDVGKGATPDEELPHHYGHEQRGAVIVAALCERLRAPRRYSRLAVKVAAQHMRCHRVFEMRPGKVVTLLEHLGALHHDDFFEEVLLVCAADCLGEGCVGSYPAGEVLRACVEAMRSVDPRPLVASGLRGSRLGEVLRQERVRRVRAVLGEMRSGG